MMEAIAWVGTLKKKKKHFSNNSCLFATGNITVSLAFLLLTLEIA